MVAPVDLHDRRADAVEHQSHRARGIGFKGQAHQAVHVGDLGHVLRGAGGVLRFGFLHHGFGFSLPSFGFLQAIFEFADAGEVLVEPRAVGGAHAALEVADLVGDGVENGPAGIEFRDLRFDLFGAALNEHLAEDAGGALFRRDGDAVAGPGEGARRLC